MRRTLFLLCMVSAALSAHQDQYYTHKSDNVALTILTGWEVEEITKCSLVTEQVADLCKLIGYKKRINIDFHHEYVQAYAPPAVFISVEKSKIINKYDSSPFELKTNRGAKIFIRVIADQIPVDLVLKAVRYAAAQEEEIKECQQQYRMKREYTDWTLYSMEPQELMIRIQETSMDHTWGRLNEKYYAREKIELFDISYFLQRDSFTVFERYSIKFKPTDVSLFKSDRLFHVYESGRDRYFILVFGSRLSLTSINYRQRDNPQLSKKILLPDFYASPLPYQVTFTGGKRAIIHTNFIMESLDPDYDQKDLFYSHADEQLITGWEGVLRRLLKKEAEQN